jgi:hypothetical protein
MCRRPILGTMILLVALSGGCSSPTELAQKMVVPVKGVVTYKGKPLTTGSIRFEPVDAGREAYGTIQPDGTFVLSTFKEGDGAFRGTHTVVVTGVGRSIPAKYGSAASSQVEVEVKDEQDAYAIDLKGPCAT